MPRKTRDPYSINLEGIMTAAFERGCFLEVNAQPSRADLNNTACKMVRSIGLKVVISTDAHSSGHLGYMHFGVAQPDAAGWLQLISSTRPDSRNSTVC